jgi:hypothetical protein
MKTKLLILLPALLLCGGCARFLLPSPGQLKALASDTNSIHIHITTIYGNVDFDRNNGTGGVNLMPVTTLQVQQVK